jgi:uncharacterized membrane protein YhhN
MLRSEHLKPSPRRPDPFLAGLVSFLLGHLAYIIGLMPSLPPPASYPLVLLVTVVAVPVMRPILRSLARRGERNLAPAVAGYGVVLALMFVAAAATLFRETWSLPRSLAAALGGLLFFVSDSILAWNRFVRPVPAGSVLVHATYHPAQVLLAMSVVIP